MRVVYKDSIVDNGYEFILKIFKLSNNLYIGVIFLGTVRVSATRTHAELIDCVIDTRLLLNYIHDGNIQS
jgi:hypothetical protein